MLVLIANILPHVALHINCTSHKHIVFRCCFWFIYNIELFIAMSIVNYIQTLFLNTRARQSHSPLINTLHRSQNIHISTLYISNPMPTIQYGIDHNLGIPTVQGPNPEPQDALPAYHAYGPVMPSMQSSRTSYWHRLPFEASLAFIPKKSIG